MILPVSTNSRSSRLLAFANPARLGLEVVNIFYGRVRVCRGQTAVFAGQLVRIKGLPETSIPHRFDYVEDGVAHFTPRMDLAGK